MIPKLQLVSPILFDTYLAVIKNSIGSDMFRNYYAKVNGKKEDIMKNGELSCAFFVSSILTIFELAERTHSMVDGVILDLKKSDWKQIDKPKVGCILVWESIKFERGDKHKHIGFYIDEEKAISNGTKSGEPEVHHWTYGKKDDNPTRRVTAMFWNNKLD